MFSSRDESQCGEDTSIGSVAKCSMLARSFD
jgi:hypothetical protein